MPLRTQNIGRSKSLNIAIFHLAFIYSGGGERLVLEEAKGLMDRGHDVTIFTPVVDRGRCFPDIISQFSIKIFLPKLPSLIPQWEIFQILMTCILIPFIAHRFSGFDVILAANQPSLWLAWVVKRMHGVPYVAYLAQPTRFLHPRKIDRETGLIFAGGQRFSPATYLMKLAKPLVDWADGVSIKGADVVLANGKHAKEILEGTYGIKAVSCPAGSYPAPRLPNYENRFKRSLTINGRRIRKPYVLLTNRHFPQKRFEHAISALPVILKDNPDASLIITGGETDYTRSLKNLVRQLLLEDKVFFLGLISEKALRNLYSQAAVYIYTAPEEDFGMGMVEAMAQGTPVVAWNNAGPRYIVENKKTGFLARPFEIEDFAGKILKILRNREEARKMGESSWKRVKEHFSYRNHLGCLEQALAECVSNCSE